MLRRSASARASVLAGDACRLGAYIWNQASGNRSIGGHMGRPGRRLPASLYCTRFSFLLFLKKTPLLGSGCSTFLVSGTEYTCSGKFIPECPRTRPSLSERIHGTFDVCPRFQPRMELLLQRLGRSRHFFTAYKSPTTSMVIPFAAAEPLNCFENSLADSSSIYLVGTSISLK